jgi:sarcosine oxidase
VQQYDVVVCGLGAMGSATAYQLAKRGVRVLGIDRFAPPHDLGSTHGETRVTRLAIGEGLAYVPLAMRSHHLWREIEQEAGAELLTTNGVLIMASPGLHAHHHGKTHFLETTIEAARAFSIDHEVLTATEISARFPQFGLRGDERGYFEPSGGFVRPERAVAAQLQLARRYGATIHTDETVVDFADVGDGVSLTTNRGSYCAGTLVLAAGAWVSEILGDSYAAHFAVTRQILHWYAVAGAVEEYLPDRFPVFIWDDESRGLYGFPVIDGAAPGVKVAAEADVRSATVADVRRELSTAERFHLYDTVIKDRLPGLARDCVRAVTCVYTTTPDGDFVVDRHPDHPSVIVFSACSGHGFKHSAALGEAVAAEIVGEPSIVDLSPFSFLRLQQIR